ncbi:MAG: hypothetical protein SVT56_13430 [Chloroflexota bacterium]|nr:hypothetical protein [Chloroflexota bacterium]
MTFNGNYREVSDMRRFGFTFLEVLASLLVLTLGMTGVIGAILYGQKKQELVRQQSIAMPTALTVLADGNPYGAAAPGDWTAGSNAQGYINGFYVERSEAAGVVIVKVFERDGGKEIMQISQEVR